jgi:hypothetical protein
MPEDISIFNPRNVEDIRKIVSSAILRTWSIPMIDYEPLANSYEHDENNSSFIVRSFGKNFRVSIEEIDG